MVQLSEFIKSLNSSDPEVIAEAIKKRYELELKPVYVGRIEPLLDPANHKFTAFPITHHKLWDMYMTQMKLMWKAADIDFSNDYNDYQLLTPDEQHFVDMILAFFAASDGIVNFNLSERFTREITITEAVFVYQFQVMMENVHSETYSRMLDNIVKDPVKKQKLFDAIKTVSSIKLMADWALRWIASEHSFGHRVVAFVIVEGVFFSGAFAAIFWLKKIKSTAVVTHGKPFMNGLITSNEYIARDEAMHCTFGCMLYEMLENKLSQTEVCEIMTEAVTIAKVFIEDAVPVKLLGMNSDLLGGYIEYIADRLLGMLGHQKLYNTPNPLKFMESIGLDNKTNFHEARPTDYQQASGDKTLITINEDF